MHFVGILPCNALEVPTKFPRDKSQSPAVGPGNPIDISGQYRTPCISKEKEAGQLMEFVEFT
jgi:hypothetical protein